MIFVANLWCSLIFIEAHWFSLKFNDFHCFSTSVVENRSFSLKFIDFLCFSLFSNGFHFFVFFFSLFFVQNQATSYGTCQSKAHWPRMNSTRYPNTAGGASLPLIALQIVARMHRPRWTRTGGRASLPGRHVCVCVSVCACVCIVGVCACVDFHSFSLNVIVVH